jgi:putative ABC transport system ATP-binding protein
MNTSPPAIADPTNGFTMTHDRLLQVLETLARSCDLDFDHVQAGAAIRRSGDMGTARPIEAWIDLLTSAGASIGLNVYGVRQSLGGVKAQASPMAPWLTIAHRGDHAGEWIAVLIGRGKTFQVRSLADDEQERMESTHLQHLLGAETEHADLTWLIAEPALPMTSLRDPGDHSAVRRLVSLSGTEASDIWIVGTYAVAIGLLSLVVPLTVQTLVNTVAFGTLLQPLVVLTLVVLVALGAAAGLRVIQVGVVEMLQRRLFVRSAIDLAYRLPRVQIEGYGAHHGPELVNRFFDIVTLQKGAASLLLDGLGIVLTTLIGMVLLAFYHPLLLAFDVVLVIGIWVVLFGLGRDAVPTAIKESKAKFAVAAWLEELARHPTTFKGLGGPTYALEHADSLVRSYLSARDKHYQVYVRQLVGSLGLQVLASAVLLGLGGWLVIERQLTLGQLVAAELVVTKVVEGFAKLSKYLETSYDMVAAADKIGHLVDLPLDRSGGAALPDSDLPAAVTFRGVSYRHPIRAKSLHHIDWHLAPGSRIALTGADGSSKRMVIDLLIGYRFPATGVVELNGRDTRDLDLSDLRGTVALVRDTEIFQGTITDNISLGRPEVGLDEVSAALTAVGLLEDFQQLPAGLHTELLPGGAPLTANQAIRLTAARALAAKPSLIILDGVLDGMDRPSRDALLDQLLLPESLWTALVVTQRDDVIARCDAAYVLHDGALRSLTAPQDPDQPNARQKA